jgi:Coiled-coil domain-containing protein 124 /Oxs1
VTAYQLRVQREQEQKQQEADQREKAGKAKKMVSEEEYAAAVEAPNLNRNEGSVEARSVTAALAALSPSEGTPEDRHPEKCGTLSAIPARLFTRQYGSPSCWTWGLRHVCTHSRTCSPSTDPDRS